MKKFGIAAMVAATMLMVLVVASAAAATSETHKVDICHRTDSATNPYVFINVDADSVDLDTGNDHGQGDHNAEHRGPIATSEAVAQQLKDQHIEWGDIIPPFFDDGSPGTWPSLNWTAEGMAIFNNGCNFANPTTTTSQPPPPPPTTTTNPPSPPTTTTTTTAPPPPPTTTTTVPPPPPTTTTTQPPPPTTTTTQPPPPSTTTTTTTVPPTRTTTAPPPPPTHTQPPKPPHHGNRQPLAFTGINPWLLLAVPLLLLFGLLAYLRGRSMGRENEQA